MSITNSALAQQIANLVAKWRTRDVQFSAWMNGAVDGGPYSDGRFPLTDYLGTVQYLYSPAALAGGVTDSATAASGFADAASASATAAGLAQTAAETAEAAALSYRDAANTARDLAAEYRDSAENYRELTNVDKVAADADAADADASAAAADASATSADASATAAAVSAAAAAVSAALAETFDPALYQPINAGLTAISGLTTDSFGLGLLELATADSIRTYIGAGTSSLTLADPGATYGVDLTGGVGTASTGMRSDAVLKLDLRIGPMWSGQHEFIATTYPQIHINNSTTWSSLRLTQTGSAGSAVEYNIPSGENWNSIAYSTYLEHGSSVTGRGAWRATSSSGVITSVVHGNATDTPPHIFHGTVSVGTGVAAAGAFQATDGANQVLVGYLGSYNYFDATQHIARYVNAGYREAYEFTSGHHYYSNATDLAPHTFYGELHTSNDIHVGTGSVEWNSTAYLLLNTGQVYGTAALYGGRSGWTGLTLNEGNAYPIFMGSAAGNFGVYSQGASYWSWYDDGSAYFIVDRKLVAGNGSPGYPYTRITSGGASAGGNITISTSDPSGTPADGDIWIKRAA